MIDRRSFMLGTLGAVAATAAPLTASAQESRFGGLAAGPYRRLVIKNVRVIPGHGGPYDGPFDLIIEGNRIADVIDTSTAPISADRVIDGTGKFVMPGMLDMHMHVRTPPLPIEYVYYLKLAHGQTSICMQPDRGLDAGLDQARLSAENKILAPRIFPLWRWEAIHGYTRSELEDPANAPRIARDIAKRGMRIVSLDEWTWDREIFGAICHAVKDAGGITTVHLLPHRNAVVNAVEAARLGATMIEHHYGYAESALDRQVQDFPRDYNYENESMRFRYAGKVWSETNMQRLLGEIAPRIRDYGATMLPTRVVYEASRDILRAQFLPWHAKYTHQYLISKFEAGSGAHSAFHYDWTSDDEAYWHSAFERWSQLIFEFNRIGGPIVCGSDDPWMWATPGFSSIRELQLLRETGVHTLECLKFATHNGAMTLGEKRLGLVHPGYLADLLIVDGDPSYNLHNLYSFGAVTISQDARVSEIRSDSGGAPQRMIRTKGIVHTIKDGIVIENARVMDVIAQMVAESRRDAKPSIVTSPF